MKSLQFCKAGSSVHSIHQGHMCTATTCPFQANATTGIPFHGIAQPDPQAAIPLDPSRFYQMHLDTEIPMFGDQNDFESDEDSWASHLPVEAAAADDAPVNDVQPQARDHNAAYKLAARLVNHSNRAPLATIIEQGSYSTLNSHGSLLSVGRFPSLKSAENTSPNRSSKQRCRSLDEKALHDIQEDLAREHDTVTVAVPHARPNEEHEAADQASGTATPVASYQFELQSHSESTSGDGLFDEDDRGVKAFIRGVFQNVRGVSRTRSRSSSMAHVPFIGHRESPPYTLESSLYYDQRSHKTESSHVQRCDSDRLLRLSENMVATTGLGNQTRNCAIPFAGADLSAHTRQMLQCRSIEDESATLYASRPPVMPDRARVGSCERPYSKPIVRPGTCDTSREGDKAQKLLHQDHSMNNCSALYSYDGVPIQCQHSRFMTEASSAKDLFVAQNASYCSTMSTSYSGTVLGVDLDLQHDFAHSNRRSHSPPTPVWFTPQMEELERQASFSDSPESVADVSARAPPRRIISSALTSLLPIAAASGVVRPNYNTPKISFYSPSGNLIQPESSSPPDAGLSEDGSSPTTTTFHHNQRTSTSTQPKRTTRRPTLVPMTTPPTHKTRYPPNMQHHYKYQHPEIPQFSDCESYVVPKGPIKGCDGVVRENSLTPRSGVFLWHGQDKIPHTHRLTMHDLKAEARFYKARFIALAAAQSFAPSIPKGKTLQKRHVTNYNTYANKPHRYSNRTAETRKGKYREVGLGPFTAHALRVCFCQPYDGAGKPTSAPAAGVCMAGKPSAANGKNNADLVTKNAEHSLPNARVVGSGRRSEGGEAKRMTRRGSAAGSITRSPMTGATRRKTD